MDLQILLETVTHGVKSYKNTDVQQIQTTGILVITKNSFTNGNFSISFFFFFKASVRSYVLNNI